MNMGSYNLLTLQNIEGLIHLWLKIAEIFPQRFAKQVDKRMCRFII